MLELEFCRKKLYNIFLNLLKPGRYSILHVHITGKEADNSIRNHQTEFQDQIPIVSHHSRVIPSLKFAGHCDLIVSCIYKLSNFYLFPNNFNWKFWPFETTTGRIQFRASFIETLSMITVSKSSIFGYMSSGDNVWQKIIVSNQFEKVKLYVYSWSYDNRLKPFKNRFYGYRSIHARKIHHRIVNSWCFIVVRFNDERKTSKLKKTVYNL